MDLSIIIVNYNVKEFLQNLLHSIDKAAQNLTYEIIIVDNASDDGSVEYIKNNLLPRGRIQLIANNVNLGFGRANNIGMKNAKGKYFLLLNPDTLLSEDTLVNMVSFLEGNPTAGLAGCKILNPDGTLQLACRRSFPGPWTSFCKVTGLSSFFPNSKIFARYNLTYLDENLTYEVDAISGSFMMLRKEVYEKIGGFDEEFFMYGEDLDLCYRVQKSGYKIYYVHNTQIIHYKGESTKRSSIDETKIFYDAMHLFVKKHFSSSFLVELILRSAIVMRKFLAFFGKKKLIISSILIDAIFFNASLRAAERIYSNYLNWEGFPPSNLVVIFTVPLFIQLVISSLAGAYKKKELSVLKIAVSIFVGFFVVSSVTYFFKQFAYSRAVLLITYSLVFISFILWRIIAKLFFKVGVENDKLAIKTLVVGTSDSALQIAEKLQNSSNEYHNIIGLIGISKKEIGCKAGNFKVLGTVDTILKIIKNNQVNEVVFSSNEISYSEMMGIVSSCQKENVDFKLIGKNLDFIVGKTSVSMLDDIPVIELTYNISQPLFRFIKSAFDYTIGFLVLFLIYPFIYLAVWLGKKPTPFIGFIFKIPTIFTENCSFVGPKYVKEQSKNYLGKKGLTGLWYIENRNETESEKLDIFYARNQNLWLDLEILGKTLMKMWNRK